MRLTAEEVSRIVEKLIQEWKSSKFMTVRAPDEKLKRLLNEVILKELRVEDDLNRDVEQMLAKHEKDFQSGKLDRRKMFAMIKNQLAKERKIIL